MRHHWLFLALSIVLLMFNFGFGWETYKFQRIHVLSQDWSSAVFATKSAVYKDFFISRTLRNNKF